MNETHNPRTKSWVESANVPGTDFPIQNLPFGVFKRKERTGPGHVGIAIGDSIVDMDTALSVVPFYGLAREAAEACLSPSLNKLLSLGTRHSNALRSRMFELLQNDNQNAEKHRRLLEQSLVPMADAEMLLPAEIGDYTDFYASLYHATNVGTMLRPDNPLFPNYKHIPIGYHGRSSSIVVSGTSVRRPVGQTKADSAPDPDFGPSRLLDYELEMGFFVGAGNVLGVPINVEAAEDHIFGLCLLNDWSARDIQKWEYQPLGPFLAKNFATTISPWVVTLDALEPFRVPAFQRGENDPSPLPYLDSTTNRQRGGIDITLEVLLSSGQMRKERMSPVLLSRGTFKDMYWTIGQMVTHHASNGCNLRPGDFMGSGTVSGAAKESRGCLLELTWRGAEAIHLPTNEVRRFLEDGDEIIMRGYCQREGFVRIGFGECRGIILPSLS